MSMRAKSFSVVFCILTLFSIPSSGQSLARREGNSTPQAQSPSANLPPNSNSIDAVANEINLLRKSLQNLNTRLGEISQNLFAPDSNENSNDKVKRVSASLELLGRAEERAEILRKQLLELIEKETSYRSRLAQLDEDMRPENIERALSGIGTTRTVELRDTRRRVLESERKGLESLLNLATQGRLRLEEDLRQADSLVARLRQRLLPLIDKEIEKINPN
jgi:hypothetical protein